MDSSGSSYLHDITSGTVSNLLSAFMVFILSLVVIDQKKVLRPWIFKTFNPISRTILGILLSSMVLLSSRTSRVIGLIILISFLAYYNSNKLVWGFTVLLALTFLWDTRQKLNYDPVPEFTDNFDDEDLKNWKIKTGKPFIEENFGKPRPDLGLKVSSPSEATNSLLILKKTSVEEGIIECDINIEPYGLVNILIFCDEANDRWYMARYDSRISPSESEGILVKDEGPGQNWRPEVMSGTHSPNRSWFRARVEFNSRRITMFRDGQLIAQFNNPVMFGKKVGLFNEVEHVHVDNFLLTKMPEM